MSLVQLNAQQRKHRSTRMGVPNKVLALLNRHPGANLLPPAEQEQTGVVRVSVYQAAGNQDATILPGTFDARGTVLAHGITEFNYPK